MSTASTDRNLLVGILALQTECITPAQLIAAMQAWVFQKSERLESVLLRQKAISSVTCDFLNAILEQHLKLHGSSPEQSLAAISSVDSIRQMLFVVGDPDVEHSLGQACETRSVHAAAAAPPAGGEASTDLWGSGLPGGDRRFRVLRPHARGGLGQISVAEDLELHREVALKELQDRFRSDEGSLQRFKMEGEVTGQLEHPGIVPVYSLGTTKTGTPFYVMRFIRGDSLKEAIDRLYGPGASSMTREAKAMLLTRLLRRLIDVCNAIEYAHSRGVLHRDLKPGNIMLGKHGETLVVDWGLAKVLGKRGAQASNTEQTFVPISGEGSSETRMGSAVGTLAYMSPEQAEGRLDDLGPESDVYCLGGTLYSVLTGQPPIRKSTPEQMLADIRSGAIVAPRVVDPQIDPALEAICLKALAPRKEDRYRSAQNLADDLELWLADQSVAVYPEPFARRAGRWVKRHRLAVTTAVGMLSVAAVSLLVMNSLITRKNQLLTQQNEEIRKSEAMIASQRDGLELQRATLAELSMGVLDSSEEKLRAVPAADEFRTSLTEKSFNTFQTLYESDKENRKLGLALARSARFSGNQLLRTNKRAEAIERLRVSIDLQKKLATSADERNLLSETYRDLGNLQKSLGKLGEAAATYRLAIELNNELTKAAPPKPPLQRNIGLLEMGQIGLLSDLLEFGQAEASAGRVADAFIALADGPEADSKDPTFAMFALAWKGKLLDELGRHDEARTVFADAIERGRKWLAVNPDDANLKSPFARLLHWNADGAALSQSLQESQVADLDRAVTMYEELVAAKPATPAFKQYLAMGLTTRGLVHRLKAEQPAAIRNLERAEQILRGLLQASAGADIQETLSDTLLELANVHTASGNRDAAAANLREGIALLEKAAVQSPESRQVVRKRERLQKQLAELTLLPATAAGDK